MLISPFFFCIFATKISKTDYELSFKKHFNVTHCLFPACNVSAKQYKKLYHIHGKEV